PRSVDNVRLPRGPSADARPLEPAVGGRVRDRLRSEHHLVAAQPGHRARVLLVPDRPHDLVVLPGEGDIRLDPGARRVDVQGRVDGGVARGLARAEALEPDLLETEPVQVVRLRRLETGARRPGRRLLHALRHEDLARRGSIVRGAVVLLPYDPRNR